MQVIQSFLSLQVIFSAVAVNPKFSVVAVNPKFSAVAVNPKFSAVAGDPQGHQARERARESVGRHQAVRLRVCTSGGRPWGGLH